MSFSFEINDQGQNIASLTGFVEDHRVVISNIEVTKKFRRLGHGSKMVKWAQKLASDLSLALVAYAIDLENNRGFWIRNGFVCQDIMDTKVTYSLSSYTENVAHIMWKNE